MCRLSLVAVSRGYSLQTSRCSGFPCCGAQALGIWASVVAARRLGAQRLWYTGLVAPQHVESSQTRDGTHVLCIDGWVLTHCAVREVQLLFCKLCLVEDFFFLLCPTECRLLVRQPGIEPETPAVEAWRLKPLDPQGSPETLTFKGSLVSGKPSPRHPL